MVEFLFLAFLASPVYNCTNPRFLPLSPPSVLQYAFHASMPIAETTIWLTDESFALSKRLTTLFLLLLLPPVIVRATLFRAT
jgi:hypothetical protein